MALTIAIADTATIDISTANKSSLQYGEIYNEVFASSATIEKVIVCDPRRNKALQIVGNGVDTFTVWTTISAGFENTDILHATKVKWVEAFPATTVVLQSGGGAINKEVLAIKIVSIVLTAEMEISCTQMPDNE